MEGEKLKRRKVMVSNSILPYFIGISGDLMFFIAISTLFLTVVKGLTAAEISLLSTISNLSCILLQIGNEKSIRLGTFMLLCSSLLITFGNQYWMILIGYILYQPSFIFKKMDHVVLKSNLNYLKKGNDYIKIANKSNIIYSVITMLIALIAGNMFAKNHYTAMYFCIGICVINVLLSFCIFDVSEEKEEIVRKQQSKTKFSKIAIMTILSFALLYPIINVGQGNVTLFIQYNLQDYFDIGQTAMYLSFIIVTSRIARVLGNLLFKKIYTQLRDKVSILFAIVTIFSFMIILLGSCFDTSTILKFLFMTIGFDLILAIRDSFDNYSNDLILKNSTKDQQQKAISYLQLARRIVATTINLAISMLLLKIDLFYIIICLIILTVASLGVNIKLYKMVKEKEESCCEY